jgi:hypothetical protein
MQLGVDVQPTQTRPVRQVAIPDQVDAARGRDARPEEISDETRW